MSKEIVVDGVTYVAKDSQKSVPSGNRVVLVIDRGWIYAGDVTEVIGPLGGRIYLDNAVWVFRWDSIGFAAVVENPKQDGVELRKMSTRVDVPSASEVYRLPVSADWGL